MIPWLKFVAIQLVSAVLMVVGWLLLLVLPYSGAKYLFLDSIYGNSEDGCTGPLWYNPMQTYWRTYLWSGWRNNTNNWNRSCAVKGGPFYRWTGRGWYFQAGFRPDNGHPVLSAGRHGPKWDY